MGGGGANLVFPFWAPVGSKTTVTYSYENVKFLLRAMQVSYDCTCFKCSANVIIPVHATNSIGVSTGSTFVVIG